MRFYLLVLLLFCCYHLSAQNAEAQAAKTYMKQGDYANAILVLNRAIDKDRANIELIKELAFAYYLQRDYANAIATIQPVVQSRIADPQSFQILGMIYKALNDTKEAEKTYKASIRRHPDSGVLYSEYGELLWSQGKFPEAAEQWQKGIHKEPGFAGNYYYLSRYYYMTADKVWGLIYGEMFVNMESYSKRTPEVKTMLLEGYKKLFSDVDLMKGQDKKNDFLKAYLETMKLHSAVVAKGITPDALAILRTRFLLSWFEKHAAKFPFRLFEYQRQLVRAGLFDAYNQWIFGAADNLTTFQQWTALHADEYGKFNTFQKGRVYKVPDGQNYFK